MSQDLKIRTGETVVQWLGRLPEQQAETLAELRALIREHAPHLDERVKWSNPWYEGNANVVYLACQRRYATFGVCHGAHLPNVAGLLEGTGKDMRHVKVRSFETTPRERLIAILEEAVTYDNGFA